MDDDRITKRLQWLKQHPELTLRPSMLRRKDDHDYTAHCFYLITLTVADRQPSLGTLRDADRDHLAPWVEPTQTGEIVTWLWLHICEEYPQIRNVAFQLMPDHVHGILEVTDTLPRHIGQVIGRFKGRCTRALHYISTPAAPLWEQGYNDRVLTGPGQLKKWVAYLHDNPRRLWVKRHHPEWLTAQHGITIGNTPVTTMGNRFLLDHPQKVAVQCSRSMSDADIERECRRVLALARDGAVMVSPCVSPGEKEVMRRVFEAGFPEIILLENGFAPRQKPSGRQFDACAAGRLLLVAPWEHHNDRRTITREQCLELNRLAREISGR